MAAVHIKVQEYSDTDIVDKKLYFLIPYYAMRYEKCRDAGELSRMGRELGRILEGLGNS